LAQQSQIAQMAADQLIVSENLKAVHFTRSYYLLFFLRKTFLLSSDLLIDILMWAGMIAAPQTYGT
jgi:hypothetical protein